MLERVAMDPRVATTDPSGFLKALEEVTWRNFPSVTAYSFKELQNSGGIPPLISADFRRQLADYYAYMEDTAELGFAEPLRNQFVELTVGLLSRTWPSRPASACTSIPTSCRGLAEWLHSPAM